VLRSHNPQAVSGLAGSALFFGAQAQREVSERERASDMHRRPPMQALALAQRTGEVVELLPCY
jgi:hypothetical protein